MYWVTYTVSRRSTIPILFGCKLTPATCSEAAFYSKDTDKLSRIVTFLLGYHIFNPKAYGLTPDIPSTAFPVDEKECVGIQTSVFHRYTAAQ